MGQPTPIELVFVDPDSRLSSSAAYLMNTAVKTFNRSSAVELTLKASVLTRRRLPYRIREVAQSSWLPICRTSQTQLTSSDHFLVTLRDPHLLTADVLSQGFEPKSVSLSDLVQACGTYRRCCETHDGRLNRLRSLERDRPLLTDNAVADFEADELEYIRMAEMVRDLTEIWGSSNAEFLTSQEGQ